MTEHQTTEAPEKPPAAERFHRALNVEFRAGGSYYCYGQHPALTLRRNLAITPNLVYTMLGLLEECEGWLDPEMTDGEPLPLPVSVVEAMSKIYKAMEGK